MSEDNMKYDKEELLAAEETVLQDISGVLQAMDTMVEYEPFTVVRGGKELFSFRVRGLDDGEMEKCRGDATKVAKGKRYRRMAAPVDFNVAKFHSLIIITATHPEDMEFLWGNEDLQEKAKALAPWQMVDKVLLSGEKEQVIELIEQLSGYDDDTDTEEVIKNS